MKQFISICFLICIFFQSSISQDPSLTGNLWVDVDWDFTYLGFEIGVNGIKVYLKDGTTDEIVDSTLTIDSEFNFPSTSGNPLFPGSYYLEIPSDEFDIGGNLQYLKSCDGVNEANDQVDNDDNGSDDIPLNTTVFTLDSLHVEYVDLCFYNSCEDEILNAVESCAEITTENIYCSVTEMGGICGVMPASISEGDQPNPLCQAGTAENISWFAFIADEGDYNITITPTNCTSPNFFTGFQLGIYTDCSFTESVFCESDCLVETITISSNVLNPGQTHYLFIDGCAGSVCAYQIEISGNPIPYLTNIDIDEICINDDGNQICEDSEFCTDDKVIFETASQISIATYSWEIMTLSGGPYTENPFPISEENNIELNFDNVGVYSVCLSAVENGCSDWFGNVCRTITISEANVEIFDTINVCENLILDFDVNILSDQDPNGDGTSGWNDLEYEFTFGNNLSIVFDSSFCNIKQQIFIAQLENPEIILNPNADTLCVGDTLKFNLVTNEVYDSIKWTINDIDQTDSIGVLIPEAGDYHFAATIYNTCGTETDEVNIQILDTISAPDIVCDTSVIGSITLSWPIDEDAQAYWLSVNGDVPNILIDSFYVIENLEFGEVVNIAFNLIDSSKCIGQNSSFICTAAALVGSSDYNTNDIKITPNPTSSHLNIDGDFISRQTQYRIYSIDGVLLKSGNVNVSNSIDVMDLPTGVHILTLVENDGAKKWIERFVKR